MPEDDLAKFTAWDWDCEGVGNPRNASRTFGMNPCTSPDAHFPEPWACAGKVDLGADEMGELIVSGYLDSTRIFSEAHPNVAPNTAGLSLGSNLFYLNMFGSPTGATYVGPQCNLRVDLSAITPPGSHGSPEWYAQLGPWHNPFTSQAMPHAYTEGKHQAGSGSVTKRAALTATDLLVPYPSGASPYPSFIRNRVCDIGAHLADDIFPNPIADNRDVDYAEYVFALWPGAPGGLIEDAFRSNPWFSARPTDVAPGSNDNRFLYGDRTQTTTKHLRLGTMSPPLVVFNDPIQLTYPKSHLFRDTVAGPMGHPLYYWEPSPYTYTVSQNGLAASAVSPLPFDPTMPWYGARINMELFSPDDPGWQQLGCPVNNVQTFLIAEGVPSGAANRSSGSATMTGSATERERTRSAIESRMRELIEQRRR